LKRQGSISEKIDIHGAYNLFFLFENLNWVSIKNINFIDHLNVIKGVFIKGGIKISNCGFWN
jgi:hypothetical protein